MNVVIFLMQDISKRVCINLIDIKEDKNRSCPLFV